MVWAQRVIANGLGDLVSIPGRVIPKTLKMVLDTSLLYPQQYKVRIKGKVKQSRERSSSLPYISMKREASGRPWLKGDNFILLIYLRYKELIFSDLWFIYCVPFHLKERYVYILWIWLFTPLKSMFYFICCGQASSGSVNFVELFFFFLFFFNVVGTLIILWTRQVFFQVL